MKTLAVVLSGGGARGSIQLGALQALDENNIKIDAISGTSIGSVIGSLYSAGVKPYAILDIIKSKGFRDLFHFTWHKNGLMDMRKLKAILKENIKTNSFESLKIPMYVCVSNIDKGEYEIFNSGSLFNVITASASIPIVFEPVKIGKYYYVDGGLFNNLPVEPFVGKYDDILGIHVNNYKNKDKHNMKAMADRIVNLVIKQNVAPNLDKCTYIINPNVDNKFSTLNFINTEELFDLGYKHGLEFAKTYKKNRS